MPQRCEVQVQFHQPPAVLRRYFTTFYLVETRVAGAARVVDHLHPEWANLRFHHGDTPCATTIGGQTISGTSFPATGPSSTAVHFEVGTTRMWGVGILPLGWAKFIAAPADRYANGLIDGHCDPAFAGFAPLAAKIFDGARDVGAELARIVGHFMARRDAPVADEARILAIHAALVSPDVATVGQLVERAEISPRTVERVCKRAFGFSPKLLLRRQRFMRSLSQYMLDPSLRWIGAIDGNYHDQAQFVRDFKAFMGMTPTRYAAMEHPILSAIMAERARFVGQAVQALDSPEGVDRSR